MYDEFGNLKKKFRAKTQQAEAARGLPGSGRAGWEVEELGIIAYLECLHSIIYIIVEQPEPALIVCELVKLPPPLFPHMFHNTDTFLDNHYSYRSDGIIIFN